MHAHTHTHTDAQTRAQTEATIPGVPMLDAVFVPRALREVCLLAEPL